MPRQLRTDRKDKILDLPAVPIKADGTVDKTAFDRYNNAILEWSRTIADGSARGIWTPVLTASVTNPTMGTDAVHRGTWRFVDGLCFWQAFIQFGSAGTGAGSGNYRISIPFRAKTSDRTALLFDGSAELNNSGTTYRRHLRLGTSSDTHCIMQSGADPAVTVTHAAPFGWGAADFMLANGWYEPANPRVMRASAT